MNPPIVTDDKNNPHLLAIAEKFDLPLVTVIPDNINFYLLFDNGILSLVKPDEKNFKPFHINFLSSELQYRVTHRQKEPLLKAVGLDAKQTLDIIDGTAGIGRDSFLLASFGCQVTMIERSPIVSALLYDGLERLKQVQSMPLHFIHANTQDYLKKCGEVDIVYLDPMFPEKKKSALVKKEMQLLQQIVGHDNDEPILSLARQKARRRVVVKRPQWALPLENQQPSGCIKTKSYRYDIYGTVY